MTDRNAWPNLDGLIAIASIWFTSTAAAALVWLIMG
jgi:hypothetical protein